MARLILLALIVGGVYWVVRRLRGSQSNAADTPAQFETTVRCRECGAYVARRHAVTDDQGHRCRAHELQDDREGR